MRTTTRTCFRLMMKTEVIGYESVGTRKRAENNAVGVDFDLSLLLLVHCFHVWQQMLTRRHVIGKGK